MVTVFFHSRSVRFRATRQQDLLMTNSIGVLIAVIRWMHGAIVVKLGYTGSYDRQAML